MTWSAAAPDPRRGQLCVSAQQLTACVWSAHETRSASGRCDQRTSIRIPAPKPVVGQLGTAPPAMDRVVAPKVVVTGHNGSSELSKSNLTLSVTVITSLVAHIERRIAQSEDRGCWTLRQIIQQLACLALVEHLSDPHRPTHHLGLGAPVFDVRQHIHFARAKARQLIGQLFEHRNKSRPKSWQD